MSKDPAFLFYTNDFERGCQFFTDEQVGKYLRLLMAQHQHGHLSEKHMIFICKSYDKDVFSKFEQDSDGNFFNKRLDYEIDRRKNYTQSRSNNKSGKKIISKSYDNHMENENENEIEIKKEKKIEKEKKAPKNEIAIRVVEYYNQATGRNARLVESNFKPIRARLSEGLTEQDLYDIADFKNVEWSGTDQEKYLTIETLYGNKAEKYRTQVQNAKDKGLTAAQIKGKPNGNGIDHTNLRAEALAAGFKMFKK